MDLGFFDGILASLRAATGGALAALQRAFTPVLEFALSNPIVFVAALALLVGWALHRARR